MESQSAIFFKLPVLRCTNSCVKYRDLATSCCSLPISWLLILSVCSLVACSGFKKLFFSVFFKEWANTAKLWDSMLGNTDSGDKPYKRLNIFIYSWHWKTNWIYGSFSWTRWCPVYSLRDLTYFFLYSVAGRRIDTWQYFPHFQNTLPPSSMVLPSLHQFNQSRAL